MWKRYTLRHGLWSIALVAALSPTSTASAQDASDPVRGETVFRQCASCHQVGVEAANRIGPQLNSVFGRKAGALEDFRYSEGMTRAGADGITWNLETLDIYLENPKSLVSKTRMNLSGLKDPQDRADVMAYLRRFSADPANIPEAMPTAQGTDHDIDPEIQAIQGDPEYGAYLASECKSCHQASGNSDGIPSITRWPTEDFVVAMHAYKRKLRPHPIMQMMAGRLSDEEIAALAAYFMNLE